MIQTTPYQSGFIYAENFYTQALFDLKEVSTADGSVAVEFSHYFRIVILKKVPLI